MCMMFFFTWYMLLQMGNRERAVYLDGWGILTCMSHNSQNISRHPRIWWVWSPTWTKMPKHQDPKGPPKSVVIVTTTGAQVERGCYCSRFASRTWFQQGDRSRQIYYFQKGCLVVGSQGVYNHLVTCCLAVSRQISVFSEAYCKSFGQETHGIFFWFRVKHHWPWHPVWLKQVWPVLVCIGAMSPTPIVIVLVSISSLFYSSIPKMAKKTVFLFRVYLTLYPMLKPPTKTCSQNTKLPPWKGMTRNKHETPFFMFKFF